MLEEILTYLNNWFTVEIYEGEYKIEDGGIVLPFLKENQYFRISGSVFNDGLHQYPASGMTDEEFFGTVWVLAVPQNIVDLSETIKQWQDKQGSPSAYTSESFGGYSYSKATNSKGVAVGWQEVFGSQLKPYKKIRETAPIVGQRPIKWYDRPFNPDYPWR